MENEQAIRAQLEIATQQLQTVMQQVQAVMDMLPCEHLEVDMIEGATMGNVKYRCKKCGKVVDGDV